MAKDELKPATEGPLAIRDAPLELGQVDLSAWLPSAPGATSPIAPASKTPTDILASLAVEVWRLKGRLGRLRDAAPEKDVKPVDAAVARMAELLTEAGVETDDPVGRPFHEGDPCEVLVFEPGPGLTRPTVVQTVKPAVRVAGRVVRRAEVVVGTPGPAPKGGPA